MSFTSTRGVFKLTSLLNYTDNETIFAGRGYVPESYKVGFAISNNTGSTINTCAVSVAWYYRTGDGDANLITGGGQIYSSESAAWSGSKTFTGSPKLNRSVKDLMYSGATASGTLRISPVKNYGFCITIRYKKIVRNANGEYSIAQMVDYIRFDQKETDHVMPVWVTPFKPSIEVNAVRFDPKIKMVSDEGTKILISVKLNTRGTFTPEQMIAAGYPSTLSIAVATSKDPNPSGSTTVSLSDCMSGVYEFMVVNGKATATVTAPEIYDDNVPLSMDWVLTVGFNDLYEPARNGVLIRGPFSNVHLSEFKGGHVYGLTEGGVCFGGFSKAPEFGYAAFESYYPTFLYGGIKQIGKKNADGSLWNELAPSSGVTTPGTYGDALQYRIIENKCIIKGSVMIKPGEDTVVIADLPEECKPTYSTYRLNGCQGARVARVAARGVEDVNYYGKLVLEWVYNIGGSQFTSNAIWVDCSIEYWIDGGEN